VLRPPRWAKYSGELRMAAFSVAAKPAVPASWASHMPTSDLALCTWATAPFGPGSGKSDGARSSSALYWSCTTWTRYSALDSIAWGRGGRLRRLAGLAASSCATQGSISALAASRISRSRYSWATNAWSRLRTVTVTGGGLLPVTALGTVVVSDTVS